MNSNPDPRAPMSVRSAQTVTAPKSAAAAKNGSSGATSRRTSSRPRRHHSTTSSSAGSVAVTDLLSRAHAKSPNASSHGDVRRCASNRRYESAAARKNTPDWVFFSSLIHATDSTCTGWSANTNAASQGHGTARCRRISANRNAASACSVMDSR